MCFICLSVAAAGTAVVAIDKKYNDSKVTDCIKGKLFNSKKS